MDFEFARDNNGNPYLETSLTGYALLSNPLLNKGMAFTQQERLEFNLLGLIPPQETTLAIQRSRSFESYQSKQLDIEKYIYLRDLQDSNETLFYSLLCENIAELMPVVYTPVVGLGCQQYSHIYRRPRGVYLAYPHADKIDTILADPRFNNVKVIVVSDGERILGLGDQGAGGMGIPIGKLALYSACAGIHPTETLPILLDTGTNNIELLHDPLYIGWHHERIRGKEYDNFIEQFVISVKKRFPHVLLQWEDFAQINANPILERYRDQLCTFNDDIQGTAAVTAGTLFAAIKITGTRLRDQRIVVVGGGGAGCGISKLLMKAMIADGLTEAEAKKHFFIIDQQGLLTADMPDLLSFQYQFAQQKSDVAHWTCATPHMISLQDTINHVHPTLLIGVSGQPGIFTENIVRTMAAFVERPIIFPLSNPTERCEATPTDLLKWTEDRAIIGTGSPFSDVIKNGLPFRVDQTNNCYIFPGMGLGLIAVKAKYITENMFMLAAQMLADCSPAKTNPNANLLPPLTQIRDVSYKVAVAVAEEAISAGIADFNPKEDIKKIIQNMMWNPEYINYKKTT
jgi:malate dehydrogenase (oxaloacetate-decarboxylating)